MLTYLLTVMNLARLRLDTAAADRERGAISGEYLIWAAAMAVAAIAIAAIVTTTLTNKANSIDLGS